MDIEFGSISVIDIPIIDIEYVPQILITRKSQQPFSVKISVESSEVQNKAVSGPRKH